MTSYIKTRHRQRQTKELICMIAGVLAGCIILLLFFGGIGVIFAEHFGFTSGWLKPIMQAMVVSMIIFFGTAAIGENRAEAWWKQRNATWLQWAERLGFEATRERRGFMHECCHETAIVLEGHGIKRIFCPCCGKRRGDDAEGALQAFLEDMEHGPIARRAEKHSDVLLDIVQLERRLQAKYVELRSLDDAGIYKEQMKLKGYRASAANDVQQPLAQASDEELLELNPTADEVCAELSRRGLH